MSRNTIEYLLENINEFDDERIISMLPNEHNERFIYGLGFKMVPCTNHGKIIMNIHRIVRPHGLITIENRLRI